jgi:hypothetical protein
MQPLPPSDEVWSLLSTDDPGEVVYRTVVSKDVYIPGQLVAGTALRDAPTWVEKNRVSDFGSYVLTTVDNGPPGWLYVHFVKPRTEEERWTPVKTTFDTGVETWPEILEGLRIVEDVDNPIAVQTPDGTKYNPRFLVFYVTTPQTTAECMVKVDIYQSEVPFKGLASAKPIPGQVSFDYGAGGSGSFTALHPLVKVPRLRQNYRMAVDATPGFTDAPLVADQIFPATEFEDWEPFIWRQQLSQPNGLYRLERVTIYPPEKPEPKFT